MTNDGATAERKSRLLPERVDVPTLKDALAGITFAQARARVALEKHCSPGSRIAWDTGREMAAGRFRRGVHVSRREDAGT